MSNRLRPRPRKPRATVRELAAALRSIGKKPPAPSVRHRRHRLRFYERGKVIES
jgi:hypothetical protein